MTISGHKIGAMKGSGALFIRSGLRAIPLLRGGGQEKGLRSGTGSHAPDRGPGCRRQAGQGRTGRAHCLSQRLKGLCVGAVPGPRAGAGGGVRRGCVPPAPSPCRGTPARWWCGIVGDQGFCLSAGSACHRGKASHVYAAMNLSKPVRDGMLRVSFGPSNTKEEVDKLAQALLSVTQNLVAAGR